MRKLLALGAVAVLAGCLQRAPRARAETRTPVSVAFVVDEAHGEAVSAPPQGLVDAVVARLEALNLEPQVIPYEQLAPAFQANDDTRERFKALTRVGQAPLALLVETQATFFDQLEGRYRWTVSSKLTVGKRDAPTEAREKDFDLPAVLQYPHQKVPAAITEVARPLAERAAKMFDGFISKETPR